MYICTMNENFNDIKVGDEVIVCLRDSKAIETVEKVNKVTFVAGGCTFRKDDGYEKSRNAWYIRFAERATEEKKNEVKRDTRKKRIVNYLSQYPFRRLELESLEKILEIIKEKKEDETF